MGDRTRSLSGWAGAAPFRPALTGAGVLTVKTDQRRFRVLEGGRVDGKYDKR
jgi:hypothetical protein